jgi:hypothetical protein
LRSRRTQTVWIVPHTPLLAAVQGEGIQVDVSMHASNKTRVAAEALVKVLREVPIRLGRLRSSWIEPGWAHRMWCG